MIYIAFMTMMQHACVILDKSFFFLADSSSAIDCQYVLPVSPSLNAAKAFQRKNLTLFAYVFHFVIIFLKYSGEGFTVMKLSLTEPSGHPGWLG